MTLPLENIATRVHLDSPAEAEKYLVEMVRGRSKQRTTLRLSGEPLPVFNGQLRSGIANHATDC